MPSTQEFIQTNRAALFDWLVILTSFMLGFLFPSLSDLVRNPGFYYWVLAALLLYTVGAILKDLPLSYRLRHSAKNTAIVPYILFLVIGHWFIIFLLIVLAGPSFQLLFGTTPPNSKNTTSWQLSLASIIIPIILTWLVYRTKSKRKSQKKYAAGYLFRQELLADIFLIAGVSIFSFIFWEKGAMAMLSQASTRSIGDIWFLFVFLAILFLFFYLPLRYLYFMENREGAANRKRLLLIFGFLLIKALFEMLNI